ncbi:MAG: hypothetical protein AB7I27_06295 [Bacteriovoracaceae bacterium]
MKKILLIDDSFQLSESHIKNISELLIIPYTDDVKFLQNLFQELQNLKINYQVTYPSSRYASLYRSHADSLTKYLQQQTLRSFNDSKITERFFGNKWGQIGVYSITYELNPIHNKILTHFLLFQLVQDLKKEYEIDSFEIVSVDQDLLSLFGKGHSSSLRDFFVGIYQQIKNIFFFFIHKYYANKYQIKFRWKKSKKLFVIYLPFYRKSNGKLKSSYLLDKQDELDVDFCYLGMFADISIQKIKETYADFFAYENGKCFSSVPAQISSMTYLKIWLGSLWAYLVLFLTFRPLLRFEGANFGNFFRSTILKSFSSGKIVDCLSLIEVMQECTVDEVRYLFENYGWERALNYSLKTFHSKTKTVALQNYAFGPKSTNFYFPWNAESQYIPDELWVLGDYFKNLLLEFHWPEELLKFTSSYRYRALIESVLDRQERKSDQKKMAVLFNVNKSENLLLYNTYKNIFKKKSWEIIFREHPVYPSFNFLGSEANNLKFQNGGSLYEFLAGVDFVLCGFGGVGLEAFVLGKKVILPLSNKQLNLATVTAELSKEVLEVSMEDVLKGNLAFDDNLNQNYPADYFFIDLVKKG